MLCSAFMIGNGKLLTNAHCVEHNTQVISQHLMPPLLYTYKLHNITSLMYYVDAHGPSFVLDPNSMAQHIVFICDRES